MAFKYQKKIQKQLNCKSTKRFWPEMPKSQMFL